jgi:predicted dehydrogenase
LINDPDLDAYVVCVHRRCLAPLVLQALAPGKPVLSEKPMAYTYRQAERLVGQCRPGQAYAVGYMKRHDPGVRLFQDLLASEVAAGRMGKIIHVAMRDFCPTYAAVPPIHFRSDESKTYRYEEWARLPDDLPADYRDDYETTLNVLSHDLNLARRLFGDRLVAQSLTVRAARIQTAILNAGPFDLVLQSGRSDSGAWDQSVEVFFERGRMTLRLVSPLARDETASVVVQRPTGTDAVAIPEGERTSAFRAQIAHFMSAILDRCALECSGSDSLKDVALVEDLWRRVLWRT